MPLPRSLVLAALVALASPALGEDASRLPAMDPPMKHGAMKHDDMPMGDNTNPSTAAFMKGMERMHRAMGADYTGDTDADFLRHMIPHHQGAIDMAKVELRFGRDETVKALARTIIAAQEREIAEMKTWLAQRGR